MRMSVILRPRITPSPFRAAGEIGGGPGCRRLALLHTIRAVSKDSEHRSHLLWDEESGPIQVDVFYEKGRAGWRVRELRVAAVPEKAAHSIDTALLRRVGFGKLFRLDLAVLTDADAIRENPWEHLPDDMISLIRSRLESLENESGEKLGPRSLPFRHYAELAAHYEAAARAILPSTAQVAEWAQISRAAAEKRILRARELGFLPPPRVGRQMSWQQLELEQLFPAAKAWWEQEQREKKAEEQRLREEQGE